jgi:hypothetical protein
MSATMSRKRTTLFTTVNSKYGAPMGRSDVTELQGHDTDAPLRFRLERCRWVDGAYDQGGAYWGMGEPVYLAVHETDDAYVRRSYRARSRSHAIGQLRGEFPNARVRS